MACWKRKRDGKPHRSYTKALFNSTTLGGGEKKRSIGCVCQQDPDQVTQSDLNQPGLIKAPLRPGGLETQHCFCCPIPKVYSPWRESEREGRGGGVLLIREKETIPWLRCTLFHSLLVEIKQFLYFYVCFLQPLDPLLLPPPMLFYRSPFFLLLIQFLVWL